MAQPVKLPGPDHPITIEPRAAHVVVTVGAATLADTRDALALQESTYPSVLYIPRDDVDLGQLERTDHSTHCPYKGDASYYSIPALGERGRNAVCGPTSSRTTRSRRSRTTSRSTPTGSPSTSSPPETPVASGGRRG